MFSGRYSELNKRQFGKTALIFGEQIKWRGGMKEIQRIFLSTCLLVLTAFSCLYSIFYIIQDSANGIREN